MPPSGVHNSDVRGLCNSPTSRMKLLRQYNVLVVVCLIWVVLGPLLFFFIGLPMWVCVGCSLFFAVMGMSCYWICNLIRGLDFGRMTICELLMQVEKIIKGRIIHKYVGLLLAIPLLGSVFYYFSNYEIVLLGGVVGIILGCAIGFMKDAHIRRLLREIRHELMTVE